MSSADRWNRIEELFQALFEMPAEHCRRALDRVKDADLRAEVAALLTAHEDLLSTNVDFLAHLDRARSGALLDDSDPPIEGAIGRYRILRRLGRGGMGLVYQAHDPLLDRPVAVKLLPPHLSADPAAVRRLAGEARAASVLDHPNIGTVYEIGESDDGRLFIAMAYYEGETLREWIARGPLPVDAVIHLGVQLAEGLSAAHRSGIIHQDIKPENLLVTGDGLLKIIDFGVARAVKDELASAGLPRGTAVYMSPEQTRGETVDQRTDIWSVGVVLHEMLVGVRPFGGDGEALINAVRHDPPPSLSTLRGDLPPALVGTVARCLEKDRERRFEFANALATDLRNVEIDVPGTSPTPRRNSAIGSSRILGRLVRIAAAAAVAAVVLIGISIRGGGRVAPPASAGAAAPSIAVLPFEVRGEGLEVWREGMVDLLSVGLDEAANLRAVDSRTVLARWNELAPAERVDLAASLRVARATEAHYALLGSAIAIGPTLRLVGQVYRLDDGRRLGTAQVEGAPSGVVALVDDLARETLGVILDSGGGALPPVDVVALTTHSLPALKAFLEGERLFRRGEFRAAIVAYTEATEADSTFAFAWSRNAFALGWIGDRRSDASRQRAARHADRLPERRRLVVEGYENLRACRIDSMERVREATHRYPDDAETWYLLGEYYYHCYHTLATLDDADRAFLRAVALDPTFGPYRIHLTDLAFRAHDDSALAAERVAALKRAAAGTPEAAAGTLALELAFGHAGRRAALLDSLQFVETDVLRALAPIFLHPRFWEIGERSLLLLKERDRLPPPWVPLLFHGNLFQRGKLAEALRYVRAEGPGWFPACDVLLAHSLGIPLPEELLETYLGLGASDSTAGPASLCKGVYALDKGRKQEVARVIAMLRRDSERALAEGDSLGGLYKAHEIRALEGYASWKNGDPLGALPLLEDAMKRILGESSRYEFVLQWIGQIHLELDRPEEAVPHFRAMRHNPLADYYLGLALERSGEYELAGRVYESLVLNWRDADAELRPMVEHARQAMSRVTRP